jgi:hypothetical protein
MWFRSVVVITSALHAEGRQFDPGRNQLVFNIFLKFFFILDHTIHNNQLIVYSKITLEFIYIY